MCIDGRIIFISTENFLDFVRGGGKSGSNYYYPFLRWSTRIYPIFLSSSKRRETPWMKVTIENFLISSILVREEGQIPSPNEMRIRSYTVLTQPKFWQRTQEGGLCLNMFDPGAYRSWWFWGQISDPDAYSFGKIWLELRSKLSTECPSVRRSDPMRTESWSTDIIFFEHLLSALPVPHGPTWHSIHCGFPIYIHHDFFSTVPVTLPPDAVDILKSIQGLLPALIKAVADLKKLCSNLWRGPAAKCATVAAIAVASAAPEDALNRDEDSDFDGLDDRYVV
jgi:hypothetical protein